MNTIMKTKNQKWFVFGIDPPPDAQQTSVCCFVWRYSTTTGDVHPCAFTDLSAGDLWQPLIPPARPLAVALQRAKVYLDLTIEIAAASKHARKAG